MQYVDKELSILSQKYLRHAKVTCPTARSLLGDEKHFLAMFPRFSAGISTQQSSVDIFVF
jgi:hypothetical protein